MRPVNFWQSLHRAAAAAREDSGQEDLARVVHKDREDLVPQEVLRREKRDSLSGGA